MLWENIGPIKKSSYSLIRSDTIPLLSGLCCCRSVFMGSRLHRDRGEEWREWTLPGCQRLFVWGPYLQLLCQLQHLLHRPRWPWWVTHLSILLLSRSLLHLLMTAIVLYPLLSMMNIILKVGGGCESPGVGKICFESQNDFQKNIRSVSKATSLHNRNF